MLACDDLAAAVEAIVMLSPTTQLEDIETLERDGLEALLRRGDAPAFNELSLRMAELFKFALSQDYAALRGDLLRPQREEG